MSLRLKNWKDRPPEVANLLNPAYLSILLSKMCSGYAKPRIGMPFPLAFVGLPLILHRGTAEILPKTSRTRLHLWLDQNPEVTFSFGVRAAGCGMRALCSGVHLVWSSRRSLATGEHGSNIG